MAEVVVLHLEEVATGVRAGLVDPLFRPATLMVLVMEKRHHLNCHLVSTTSHLAMGFLTDPREGSATVTKMKQNQKENKAESFL